jgi:hypothetical protein
MGAEPPAAGPKRVSLWAVLSLLCGLVILCPVASLAAPILGVTALFQIQRRPDRRGAGLAVAGIVLGLAAFGGQAFAARWWHVNARIPMLAGPAEAVLAGQSGDVDAFMAAFVTPDPPPLPAEAMAFLDEVNGRYGALRGWAQAPSDAADPDAPPVDTRRLRLTYLYQFEAGPVETEAEFVVWDEGQGLALRFGWLAFRDPQQGDLVYPASAAGRVGYDPVPPPEPAP